MNRPLFVPQMTDAKVNQNIFPHPPPYLNWQGLPPPNEYIVPKNEYQPIQIAPQTFPQIMKSYCKSCNMWTTEPFECHINSDNHIKNKANELHELSDNSGQCNSIVSTLTHQKPYDISRNNLQTFENVNLSQLNIPMNTPIRIYNPPEQFNGNLQSMSKVGFFHPLNPKFNNGVPISNFNNNIFNNVSNNRFKNKRTKGNIIQPNHVNFSENIYPNSHDTESQNIEKYESIKIAQVPSENSSITTNKGREMLLPISGIYCPLCEEFFRNTDSAETNHCASFAHINAYEKFTQKNGSIDKRAIQSSKEGIIINRINPFCKNHRINIKCNKSPERKETTVTLDRDIRIFSENSDRDMDFDQISSSEFQGPDFSLDFPDDVEDSELA